MKKKNLFDAAVNISVAMVAYTKPHYIEAGVVYVL